MLLSVIVPMLFSVYTYSEIDNSPRRALVRAYTEGRPVSMIAYPIYQKDKRNKRLFLSRHAAAKFLDLVHAAARDGFHIKVVSAFRTYKEQKCLRRMLGHKAAKPGWSNHQLGLSVDIAGTRRTIKRKKHRTILYWWLTRNASRFGFYNDVPEEPWHWTYKEVRDYG